MEPLIPRPHSALATLAAFLVLAAGPLSAQGDGESPQGGQNRGVFVDTVDVNVVNVDVYVTDKEGNRITGLTKDDFEVFEDGRAVEISNFFAIENGRQVGGAEPVPTAEVESPARAPGAAGQAAPEVPEDQLLHLVVYIDNYNIRPPSRNKVMRELRDFLRNQLNPGDQVMLVTYERFLHVRHPFTSDPATIAAALTDLEKLSGHAVHRESDRRDIMQRVEDAESAAEAMGYVRTYASSVNNDLAFTVDALREIVDGLVGLPGRKAILYVSEGVPMIPGEDIFYLVQERFGETSPLTEAQTFNASRRFQELTAAANTGRVTFYTIDAAGLRAYSYADASQFQPGSGRPGSGAFIDRVRISNLQSTIQLMAEETGGKAIINTNRFGDDLEQVAADFRTYYSLGYSPAHASDGRLHQIKVKIRDDRGYRIRHRESYRDKSTAARMADSTLSSLLYSYERNEIGVEVGFGRAVPSERGNFVVPMRVTIPIGSLVLVPGESTHEARLRLFVVVMDSEGGMSEVQQLPMPISIPDAELEGARQARYQYSMQLLMRPGPHRVAVGVRDDVGQATSFITERVNVGGGP